MESAWLDAKHNWLPMSDVVNIEINGISLKVRHGSMVIEAADEAGITIPRFCYHKKLSVAANCRMCLVQIEKAPKPLPACATPVTEGMKIYTKSPKALEAQKGVMEFLLINHPLDCPICDQGGECELQDIAMGFGQSLSRFGEQKRVVKPKNIGPLIATDMTRCIHCTRCVRFGREIAGIMELGAVGRGEHTEIGTYVNRTVNSELSGNVIDLCPVGALTSRPYRYTGRPWENIQTPSIAPHDAVGSNIFIESRRNQVMRVLPRENEAINELWIADRERFSYSALNGDDRLIKPMIRQGERWLEVEWDVALNYTIEGLKRVIAAGGANKIGAMASSSSTVEELYLFQKLMRGLGCHNLDSRTRQLDFSGQASEPLAPGLGMSLAAIESLDAVFLIGSHIRKDQPLIGHRLRKASVNNSAQITVLNNIRHDFNFPVAEHLVVGPLEMQRELVAVLKALTTIASAEANISPEVMALFENVDVHDAHLSIAKHLHASKSSAVWLGSQAHGVSDFSALHAIAYEIARISNSRVGYLTNGANSAGASLAGVLPHRAAAGKPDSTPGLDARGMWRNNLDAYVLMNLEPEFDCAEPARAMQSLLNAEFVVSMTPFISKMMRDYADVLLPIAPFSETSGTYINVEGVWQSFTAAVKPKGESRPAWKILRVMGNLLDIDGFSQLSTEEVRNELTGLITEQPVNGADKPGMPQRLPKSGALVRIGYLPLYAIDNIVRRSLPLQKTNDATRVAAVVSSSTASALGVTNNLEIVVNQDGNKVSLPLVFDECVPDMCVMIPSGVSGSELLGAAYGAIEISKR